MTDQPDRLDVDGLRRELIEFISSQRQYDIAPELRDAILNKVIALPSPTRDGAEGARAAVQDTFDMIHQAAVDRGYDSAPPKPAPDAIEAAVILAERNFRPLFAAVPPAVAAELWPPYIELPLTFWYKNHRGEESLRTAFPISIRFGTTEWHPEAQWLLKAFDRDKQVEREFAMRDMLASPPVRGDREALLKYLDIFLHPNPEVNLSGLVCKHGLAIEACPSRECANPMAYETVIKRARDYIAALPVQPAIDREALAQAYALYRWKEKLENLSDEMKDGCYAFAGSVQSGAGERGSDATEADRYFDMAGEFGNRIQRAVMLIDDYNRHGSVDYSVAFEVKKILDPESALSRQDSER